MALGAWWRFATQDGSPISPLMVEHGEEGALVDFLMEELYSFTGEG